MLKLSEHNGSYSKIVYAGEDLSEAWFALREELLDTAGLPYSIRVIEWWFTNNSKPLEIANGPGSIDVWSWE